MAARAVDAAAEDEADILALLARPEGVGVVGDDGDVLVHLGQRLDDGQRGRAAVDKEGIAGLDHRGHRRSDGRFLLRVLPGLLRVVGLDGEGSPLGGPAVGALDQEPGGHLVQVASDGQLADLKLLGQLADGNGPLASDERENILLSSGWNG